MCRCTKEVFFVFVFVFSLEKEVIVSGEKPGGIAHKKYTPSAWPRTATRSTLPVHTIQYRIYPQMGQQIQDPRPGQLMAALYKINHTGTVYHETAGIE